ncbi:hypothetical protein PanWU01x14_208240, partial [Parasponia andersonii]
SPRPYESSANLQDLCPYLVPTEEERIRRMLEMFHPELAAVIDSGDNPPTTIAECVGKVLIAEYRLAQAKEERQKYFKSKKNQRGQAKPNQDNNQRGFGTQSGHNKIQNSNNNNLNNYSGKKRMNNFYGQRN